MRAGKIISNGVALEKHENDTIVFFVNLGKTIELIPPSNTPHNKIPDFFMDGLAWEAKCPKKTDRRTIERIFYTASRQSENVIIDLRRASGAYDALSTLERCFSQTRRVRKMYIIVGDKVQLYKK